MRPESAWNTPQGHARDLVCLAARRVSTLCLVGLLGQARANMQFSQPLGLDFGRRVHEQVLSLLIHGKGYDFADIGLVGKKHDDTVHARRRTIDLRGMI